MCRNTLREDLNFFKEMLESGKKRLNNYSNLVKNKDSKDYKRFIHTYQLLLRSLSEREKYVLDLIYGVNCNPHNLQQIAKELALSPSRIRQIRVNAERKLRKEMFFFLHPEKRNQKYFSEIIRNQPEEILLKILQATRPWEPIIKQYPDTAPTNSRRKRLKYVVYRMWMIGALDHREKIIEILNVKKEDVLDY